MRHYFCPIHLISLPLPNLKKRGGVVTITHIIITNHLQLCEAENRERFSVFSFSNFNLYFIYQLWIGFITYCSHLNR